MHQYQYPRPALTADIIIFRENPNGPPEILLIKRKHDPFENHWALPGGFCDEGETLRQAAARELMEETGCQADNLTLVDIADRPGRDPRGWTVSGCFMGIVPEGTEAIAGDDARETRWFLIDGLPEKLAFDHAHIISCGVEKLNEEITKSEAKLALESNGVFHTPMALRKNGGPWNEFQIDAIRRTQQVLSRMGNLPIYQVELPLPESKRRIDRIVIDNKMFANEDWRAYVICRDENNNEWELRGLSAPTVGEATENAVLAFNEDDWSLYGQMLPKGKPVE